MNHLLDNVFDLDLKRLALQSLPTGMRKPLLANLLFTALAPLGAALDSLRRFRQETGYRLEHNGQVCRLRGALNDVFDPELRRITVEDGPGRGERDAWLAWLRETGRWTMVPGRGRGAALLRRRGYGGTGGYDFWVNLPRELRDAQAETRLRGLVDVLKLASRRYGVNYV